MILLPDFQMDPVSIWLMIDIFYLIYNKITYNKHWFYYLSLYFVYILNIEYSKHNSGL